MVTRPDEKAPWAHSGRGALENATSDATKTPPGGALDASWAVRAMQLRNLLWMAVNSQMLDVGQEKLIEEALRDFDAPHGCVECGEPAGIAGARCDVCNRRAVADELEAVGRSLYEHAEAFRNGKRTPVGCALDVERSSRVLSFVRAWLLDGGAR